MKQPTYLSGALGSMFGAGVKQRGLEYYTTGAVRLDQEGETEVHATVQGARDYSVELRAEGDSLVVNCTCPFFQDNAACKHIWAALLAAERRMLLGGGSREFLLVEEELDEDLEPAKPAKKTAAPMPRGGPPPPPAIPWRTQLATILNRPLVSLPYHREEIWLPGREILWLIDGPMSQSKRMLSMELYTRDRKQNSEWGKPKPLRFQRSLLDQIPDATDQAVLGQLAGSRYGDRWSVDHDHGYYGSNSGVFLVDGRMARQVLPELAATGRLRIWKESAKPEYWRPVEWDPVEEPWRLHVSLNPDARGSAWELKGEFRRAGQTMSLADAQLLLPGGLLFTASHAAPLDPSTPLDWVDALRRGPVAVPEGEHEDLFLSLMALPNSPPVEAPDSLQFDRVAVAPQPHARIARDTGGYSPGERLFLQLSFDYAGVVVPYGAVSASLVQKEKRRVIVRNPATEEQATVRLAAAGLKPQQRDYWHKEPGWTMAVSKLPKLVRELAAEGWLVEAEGRLVRSNGKFNIEVVSGIDWFDLQGGIDFGGGATASLPELLRAARRGESMVRLDDGSYGILPEDWLRRFGTVLHMGEQQGEQMRFRRSQAGLLDALLAAQPEIRFDEQFARMREQLQRFHGITPAPQPAGFVGQLRGYQLEGLGWLEFLREFGLGGCLADDMGVGKTAQVLALLETRRAAKVKGPSLVVVPKSLVFNWQQEAARFTPKLRLLEYTGIGRSRAEFAGHDVVLTTYGTLRRDAVEFQGIDFDYVVLDEATAIKNPTSESAKAVRLLKARHRLAMSGTPVENHLGELWSLFEFLNPGMMGASTVMQLAGASLRNPSEETRKILALALRPYILRRTKEQVASELPAKVEQTLYCELEPEQRKMYQELLDHYRGKLLGKIDKDGIGKSKMQVLEALLRLRQAACHPGLIDKKRGASAPSAKLEILRLQLGEVLAEGHKALVFSQFTSFLALLREQLDEDGIRYAYLDGDTRDRQAAVQEFQEDDSCKLFLISLKAGGLGLNLTAAEYVFLLDPWWNPAVEAQAIDRAHRIGQTRRVFAYRLIARDTVEEKVLKLQETKRDLADAIISADNSLVRGLKREDVELLLS